MEPFPKIPKSEDIMREATKKLEKIKHQRDIESKFLSKHESYQEHLDNFEKNLSKKIFNQKIQSSQINEKTFYKIYSLLEKFSKLDPVQISNISKLFSNKTDSITQTDTIDEKNLINKLSIMEKENEVLFKEKNKLKNENEVLKKENEELKIMNNKLNSQYVQLNLKIEEDEKNKKEIEKELDKINNNNLILESKIKESNKIIDDLKTKLKNYEEKIKWDLAQKQSDKKFSKFIPNPDIKITFIYLIKAKQLYNIYEYLDIKDIINFRLCCKDINKIFNKKIDVLNRFYLNIIKQKNNAIFKLNKYDVQKNYLTKIPQLEQLIKIYSLEGKQPAQGLRLSIDNALYFINKVVKAQLGIKPSRQKNINQINYENNSTQISNENNQNTAMDSFFGGVKSLFGFGKETNTSTQTTRTMYNNNANNRNNYNNMKNQISTPNKFKTANNSLNVSPIIRSTATSKESSFISNDNTKFDIAQSDELILNEINNTDYGLKSNYEFEYTNSDDINQYLTKFLKSPFPVEKLTDFITQLCSNFCELLFNSYFALKDFHQLTIVNKTLNERFKFFYEASKKKDKIIKALNIEKNQNLNNMNNINKSQRDLSEKMISEGNLNISKINEEENFDDMEKKLNICQMNLNISNKKAELYEKKYEEIKSIYLHYKEITMKENADLKFQIELALKEKNEVDKKLKDLNNFFQESNNSKDEI